MTDSDSFRLRCLAISYRAGFLEVSCPHPQHVNLETWDIHPDAIQADPAWVTDVADEVVTGNTELELDVRQALELADALQLAVSTAVADHAQETCCEECGSTFLASAATMSGLCRECAHYLYGKPNCAHSFRNGRCQRCLWDGSVSAYVARLKGTSH